MRQHTAINKMLRQLEFEKNHGVAGVIYVLSNDGLKNNWFKIGCSRHSGIKRAGSLNNDPRTKVPGKYVCIFEFKTIDCGLAEQLIFQKISKYRKGKKGQEFFEIDLEKIKVTIIEVCTQINSSTPQDRIEFKKPKSILSRFFGF
jgi:hypothetical protein